MANKRTNKAREAYLRNFPFKQNDIPEKFWSTHEEPDHGGKPYPKPKNEYCFAVTCYAIACCEADVFMGRGSYLKSFLECLKLGAKLKQITAPNYTTMEGVYGYLLKSSKFIQTCYSLLTDSKKSISVETVGWYKRNDEYFGNFDYQIINCITDNGNGHFRLPNYDPWDHFAGWKKTKSIKYIEVK